MANDPPARKCPNCDETYPDAAEHCPYCGHEEIDVDPIDVVDAATWTPPDPPEAVLSMHAGDKTYGFARRGEVTLVAGAGFSGKTYLGLGWAKGCATGGTEAAGMQTTDGAALVLSFEGGAAQAVRRLNRLASPEAELPPDRLLVVAEPSPLIEQIDKSQPPLPTEAWDHIRSRLDSMKNPAIMMMDPITSTVNLTSRNEGGSVRHAMRELEELAREYDIAIVGIAHSTKHARYNATELLTPGEFASAASIVGSHEWYDTPRAAGMMLADPGTGTAIFICTKTQAGQAWWAIRLEPGPDSPIGWTGWTRTERLSPREYMEFASARQRPESKKAGAKETSDEHADAQFRATRDVLAPLPLEPAWTEDVIEAINDHLPPGVPAVSSRSSTFKSHLERCGWTKPTQGERPPGWTRKSCIIPA